MPIVPDDKDWTWVLERACPECGFDASGVPAERVPGLIRTNARRWADLAERPDRWRERPTDDRWSAVEYACHVRDVYRLFDGRLRRMLDEDDPTFADWDQDVAAVEHRYGEAEPRTVVDDLTAAATVLAAGFEDLDAGQWRRTGTRSDGARFTVETFARYLVHDAIHHVWDVEQGLAALDRRRA
jgi:hypothetical protein